MPRSKAKAHCRSQKKAAQQAVPCSVYKHWHYNLLMTHFCHQLAYSAPSTLHMTVSHKPVFSEQPDKSCAPSVLHNQIERPAAFCRQATGQQGPDIQHTCLPASNLHLHLQAIAIGLQAKPASQPDNRFPYARGQNQRVINYLPNLIFLLFMIENTFRITKLYNSIHFFCVLN